MSISLLVRKIIAAVFVLLLGSSITYVAYGYFDTTVIQDQKTITVGEWADTCVAISTPQEFFNFATSATSTSSDYYCLVNDIDFTGFTWNYINAYDTNRFMGTFDGNGYTLSNLRMTTNETQNVLFSIFSTIDGATIRNVVIDNFGPDLTVGAFNASDLDSSIFASEVYGLNNLIENVTITNSQVLAKSVNGAGGLVTTVKSDADIVIRNIKVRNLSVANNERRAGGLISSIESGTGTITIEDIDFIGTVAAQRQGTNLSSDTGGLVGTVLNVNFTASRVMMEYTAISTVVLSDGQVSYTSGKNTGGFVGANNTGSVMAFNDCFYTGSLYTDRSYIGTVIGREKTNVILSDTYYSNVFFSTSYVATTSKSVINGTMVLEQAMPSSSWWNTFASDFFAANSLWTQDATGRLELDRS